jgi:hypothetical protein
MLPDTSQVLLELVVVAVRLLPFWNELALQLFRKLHHRCPKARSPGAQQRAGRLYPRPSVALTLTEPCASHQASSASGKFITAVVKRVVRMNLHIVLIDTT